ncbi:unnamed protein product [Ranitomeya imitator]|uniref:ribonuclease H n=1 Tax=Ranitomeya imitator TaxID=111125 RepID=A0ABN9L274_9NEOB|nr:unnamed protein product [Ranitomeya imitator]
MPFGLANAPSVFQSFMHDIFQEYLDKFLIVYLDDILIFSDDWESHVKQVEVDASEIGAGAVLSQRSSDCSVIKPCAFFSRKFSPAKRNYDVGNRELLAMKWAFEEWRHWLEGAKHCVVDLNDHKNLTYLESAKRLNPRQARWSLFFARFDFVISYLPGSKNVKADALSRSFVPDSPGLSEPAGILKEGTNGQTERTNQTLETYLRCFVSADQDDWVSFLPLAEFALNNRASSATLVSPFFCNSGFHPRFSSGQVESSDCPGVDTVVDRLQQIWTHVVDNLTLSQEKAQRFANRRRCVGPRLRVGDLVWLSSRHIPMKVSSPKFKPRFIGLYRISEVLNPVSFRLTLPDSFSIHNVFHRSLLRRYVAPMVPSVDPPAPVLVEGELEYIVEKILDSRVSRRKLQYLVKWKGYAQEDNSWVFASDVHAPDLVRAFHMAHPGRPGGSGNNRGRQKGKRRRGGQCRRGTQKPDGDTLTCKDLPLVVNISSKNLDTHQLAVLQKGLSFCPMYKFNSFELSMDLQRFYRNLRLRVHFSEQSPTLNPSTQDKSLLELRDLGLRTHSSFMPPRSNPPVETFVSLVERDIHTLTREMDRGKFQFHTNLSHSERLSLEQLSSDKSLIIKPADKGGTTVIMDRTDYLDEVFRQLGDTTVYKAIPYNPLNQLVQKIAPIVDFDFQTGTIDSEMRDFLIKSDPHILHLTQDT